MQRNVLGPFSKKKNFFQLNAEVMKSLDILKNETDVFYATCLNIFLVCLSENITHFSTVQKYLSLSPLHTIKDMHFTLYVHICLVRLSENITQFSTLQKYLSLSPSKICTLRYMFTYV